MLSERIPRCKRDCRVLQLSVHGHDGQMFYLCLGYEETIKGISVMQRERGHVQRVGVIDG